LSLKKRSFVSEGKWKKNINKLQIQVKKWFKWNENYLTSSKSINPLALFNATTRGLMQEARDGIVSSNPFIHFIACLNKDKHALEYHC
jgi:hypothetical protein